MHFSPGNEGDVEKLVFGGLHSESELSRDKNGWYEMTANDSPCPLSLLCSYGFFSGEGGIRTLGTLAGTTVFETVPIDRSGTSPTPNPL
jgi:hypothetical protein